MIKLCFITLFSISTLIILRAEVSLEDVDFEKMMRSSITTTKLNGYDETGATEIQIGTSIELLRNDSCTPDDWCHSVKYLNSDGEIKIVKVTKDELYRAIKQEIEGPFAIKKNGEEVELDGIRSVVIIDADLSSDEIKINFVDNTGVLTDQDNQHVKGEQPSYTINVNNYKNGIFKRLHSNLNKLAKNMVQLNELDCDYQNQFDELSNAGKDILALNYKASRGELIEEDNPCAILKLKDKHKSTLGKEMMLGCLKKLREKFLTTANSKTNPSVKVLKKFYSELTQEERDFLSMIITAYGEAGVNTPPKEEFTIIMKVLEERLKDTFIKAIRKQQSDKPKTKAYGLRMMNAELLDTAIQHKQFSIYDDDTWLKFFKDNQADPNVVKDHELLIEAYSQYKNPQTKYLQDGKEFTKPLTHYVTAKVYNKHLHKMVNLEKKYPSLKKIKNVCKKSYLEGSLKHSYKTSKCKWFIVHRKNIIPRGNKNITVDGVELQMKGGHLFFEDIPWTPASPENEEIHVWKGSNDDNN